MFARPGFKRACLTAVVAALALGTMPTPAAAVPTILRINEIRVDEPSTDNNEYFELHGTAGSSLDGYTYLVIGDWSSGGSGVVEAAVSLNGLSIPADGHFLCAESTLTFPVTPDLVTTLDFENLDNVTHMLVTGWSGSVNQDLDTNDDGVFDTTPWTSVADTIALIKEDNPPVTTEYHYGPPSIGPDSGLAPWHVLVLPSGWAVGPSDIVGGWDTPGAANYTGALPTAVNDSYSTAHNTTLLVPAPGVLANDAASPVSATKLSDPAQGTLTFWNDGGFQYVPTPGYSGTVSFTYRCTNMWGDSGIATVQISVDPLAVTLSPVWRFYNSRLGTHFYTSDEGEKNRVQSTMSHIYTFEGESYRLNPANNATPLYRFFKPSTGTHFYTASESEKNTVRGTLAHIYSYEGPAYNVSADSAGGTKPVVHRFYNMRNGTHFYTADESERAYVAANLRGTYSYDGAAFYLGQ